MDSMNACIGHREYQQIFHLEKMLKEAEYPHYFNYWNDQPIKDWDSYNFVIEIERPAGAAEALITITFDENKMLRLTDSKKKIVKSGMISENCMEYIEEFFKTR